MDADHPAKGVLFARRSTATITRRRNSGSIRFACEIQRSLSRLSRGSSPTSNRPTDGHGERRRLKWQDCADAALMRVGHSRPTRSATAAIQADRRVSTNSQRSPKSKKGVSTLYTEQRCRTWRQIFRTYFIQNAPLEKCGVNSLDGQPLRTLFIVASYGAPKKWPRRLH